MEDNGIIQRYTIDLNEMKTKKQCFAYILVRLRKNNISSIEDIEITLQKNSNIIFCDYISGEYDFIVYAGTETVADMYQTRKTIADSKGVAKAIMFFRGRQLKKYNFDIEGIL